MQRRNLAHKLISERVPIVWKDTEDFSTTGGYIRAHWLTLRAEHTPEIHRGREGELTLQTKKKRPLGYSRLDDVQVWLTEGARSRNHKKTH